ncbi:MAG: hypothetical protein Greene041619_939 [Candidatus Peregrinibacteria bacterium Greene0416_19]|nr:MAG: hypothetical protein Greene041619_939 [Candidatus Peregrinibacteria bacterium Greene0416_19]
MPWLLSVIFIVGSFFLIKYREQAGDMIGEADWMRRVGGVYNLLIFVAVFLFFFGVAGLTGTTDFFFGWLKYLIPGGTRRAVETGV